MKEYCRFIALLAIVLLIFLVYGASGYVVRINDWTLDKIDVPCRLGQTQNKCVRLMSRSDRDVKVEGKLCEGQDSVRRRILIFGDSMVELLAPRLSDYAESNGYELYSVCWYSSTTLGWADHSDALQGYLDWAKPDFVLISLGGNELTTRNTALRRSCVRKISKLLEAYPVVWIAPPSWVKKPTITHVIRGEVGEGRYYDSTRLSFRRARDRMHPTLASASVWMDSIAVWIESPRCAYPLRMTRPQSRGSRRWNQKILRPDAL